MNCASQESNPTIPFLSVELSWFTISGLVSGKLNEGSVGGFFSVFQPWEAEGTEGPIGRVSSVFQQRGTEGRFPAVGGPVPWEWG